NHGACAATFELEAEKTGGTAGIESVSVPSSIGVAGAYCAYVDVSVTIAADSDPGTTATIELTASNESDGTCDPVVMETCTATATVTVVKLEIKGVGFDSDHGLMRDNNTDYEPTGDLFQEPEWTLGWNHPISHTMDLSVDANLIIDVSPPDMPQFDYQITCSGPQGFNFDVVVPLESGLNFPDLTSTDKIDKKIQKITQELEWEIMKDGYSYLNQATGPHAVYATMGIPRDTGLDQHVVTQKRMERTVTEVGATGSLDPHIITLIVIQAQGRYDPDANRPNAWVLPDFPVDHRGDCQTIIRYAGKVLEMSGVPGTFQHVHVYATNGAPNTAIAALIDAPNPTGLCTQLTDDGYISHPENPTWKLFLEDEDGKPNCYEAAAKLTYEGTTKYYPGGVPGAALDIPLEVLHLFHALSWFEYEGGTWVKRGVEVIVYP
ncbi:MAG: hypothetical protein WBE26_12170, partial [Phycisphaerae bacterium]